MTSLGSRIGAATLLITAGSAQAQIANPSFDSDLSGWSVAEHGSTGTPGSVVWDAGAALLTEGSAQLTVLEQAFTLPNTQQELSFDIDLTPGFDTSESFLPDALDVQLLDASGQPVTHTWLLLPDAVHPLMG